MSLCIAFRTATNVGFVSDSRISNNVGEDYGVALWTDVGIKVMDLQFKVVGPFMNGVQEVEHDQRIGLCFVGDTVTAFLVKELVGPLLRTLQAAPTTDISLKQACKVVARYFAVAAAHMSKELEQDPNTTLLIAGWCPKREQILVYQLTLKFSIARNRYYVRCGEVLKRTPSHLIIGEGNIEAEAFLARHGTTKDANFVKAVRHVCKGGLYDEVGGHPQFGNFDGHDFRVVGVVYYTRRHKGYKRTVFTYRGTRLMDGAFKYREDEFLVFIPQMDAFEDENEL